jgi:hypothetical protein
MAFLSEPEGEPWTAPLPDLSRPALSQRVRIGTHVFRIAISEVQREVPREPDTHLIQIRVSYGNQPLTAHDLGLRLPDACAYVWSFLTNRLNETVVQFYAPKQRPNGELNPRLGCWGPRPDLAERGLAEDDCGLAAVIGLATWTVGARPMGSDRDLLERLAEAVTRSLGYWVLVAERQRARRS